MKFSCLLCKFNYLDYKSEDRHLRLPIILDCCHVFCKACLEKQINISNDNLICKICKISTIIPKNIINPLEYLAIDYTAIGKQHAIEIEKGVKKWHSMSSLKKHKFKSKPESLKNCSKCLMFESKLICVDCETMSVQYCQHCSDSIHQDLSLKNHRLIPLVNELKSSWIQVQKCEQHDTDIAKFYCVTCCKTVCEKCSTCILDHNVENLKNSEEIWNEIQTARPTLCRLVDHISASQKVVQEVENRIVSETSRVYQQMSDYFSRLHRLVALQEAAARQELEHSIENIVEMQVRSPSRLLCDRLLWVQNLLADLQCLNPVGSLNLPAKNVSVAISDWRRRYEELQQELLDVRLSDNYQLCKEFFILRIKLSIEPELYLKSMIVDLKAQHPTESFLSTKTVILTSDNLMQSHFSCEEFPKINEQENCDSYSSSQQPSLCNELLSFSHRGKLVTLDKVRMSHVNNPGDFYVQRCLDYELLQKIMELCQQAVIQPLTLKDGIVRIEDLCVGDLLLALFDTDGLWYRARLIGLPDDISDVVSIFFIDYGNKESVKVQHVYRLPYFLETLAPPLAFFCQLEGVAPCGASQSLWSDGAICNFYSLHTQELQVSVFNKIGDLWSVDLEFQQRGSSGSTGAMLKTGSVRDWLVFSGFAVFHCPALRQSEDLNDSLLTSNTASCVSSFYSAVPLREGHLMNCILSAFETTELFWLQNTDERAQRALKEISCDLEDAVKEGVLNMKCPSRNRGPMHNFRAFLQPITCPVPGQACAALFDFDSQWYRAQVLCITGPHRVKVRFVDYGNCAEVDVRVGLLALPSKLEELAAMAYPARMDFVHPFGGSAEQSTEWSEHALTLVNEMLLEFELLAVVHTCSETLTTAIHPEPYGVVLYQAQIDGHNPIRESLNERLVRLGLASSLCNTELEFLRNVCPFGAEKGVDATSVQQQFSFPEITKEADPHPDSIVEEEREQENNTELEEVFNELAQCRVTWTTDPGHFYIRVRHAESDRELRCIEQALCERYDYSSARMHEWTEGEICVVQTVNDLRWWRARLLKVHASTRSLSTLVTVQLLESGAVLNDVTTSQLRLLEPEFSPDKLSVKAIRCHILGVLPAGANKWTATAAEKMKLIIEKYGSTARINRFESNSGPDRDSSASNAFASLQSSDQSYGVDLVFRSKVHGNSNCKEHYVYQSLSRLLHLEGVALPDRRPAVKHQLRVQSTSRYLLEEVIKSHTSISSDVVEHIVVDSVVIGSSPNEEVSLPLLSKHADVVQGNMFSCKPRNETLMCWPILLLDPQSNVGIQAEVVSIFSFDWRLCLIVRWCDDTFDMKMRACQMQKFLDKRFGDACDLRAAEPMRAPASDFLHNWSKQLGRALVVARFGQWHRASLIKNQADGRLFVHFVDSGEMEFVVEEAARPFLVDADDELDILTELAHTAIVHLHDIHPCDPNNSDSMHCLAWPSKVLTNIHYKFVGQRVQIFAQQSFFPIAANQLEMESSKNSGQAVRAVDTNNVEIGDIVVSKVWGFRYDFEDPDEVFLHTPNWFTTYKQIHPPSINDDGDGMDESFLPVTVTGIEKPSVIFVHLCRRFAPRGTKLSQWRLDVNKRLDQLEGPVDYILQNNNQLPLFPESFEDEVEGEVACLVKLPDNGRFYRAVLLGFTTPIETCKEPLGIVQLVDAGGLICHVPLDNIREPLCLDVPSLQWKIRLPGLRRNLIWEEWSSEAIHNELLNFCKANNPMYLRINRIPKDGGLLQGQLFMDADGTRAWELEKPVCRLIVNLRERVETNLC